VRGARYASVTTRLLAILRRSFRSYVPETMRSAIRAERAGRGLYTPSAFAHVAMKLSENGWSTEVDRNLGVGRLEESHPSGADRDRTDDLRLAKPALSQLSYSPVRSPSISRPEMVSQHRPADTFSTEKAPTGCRWARAELNCRPHAYQACALTT
jgi:hypothetical protein